MSEVNECMIDDEVAVKVLRPCCLGKDLFPSHPSQSLPGPAFPYSSCASSVVLTNQGVGRSYPPMVFPSCELCDFQLLADMVWGGNVLHTQLAQQSIPAPMRMCGLPDRSVQCWHTHMRTQWSLFWSQWWASARLW